AVVYPAEEGTTVISYRVNPHKDEKGNLLNQNNLYAVWHVAGIDYVVMSATNNNCTYGVRTADGKEGITMSAKPARNYESDTSAEITLNYKWYKIYEGRYDDCFEIRDYEDKDGYKWYVDDSGNIAAYYKDGKYYAEDRTTVISKEEAEALGTKLTYKEFNPLSVNDACVLKAEQTNKKPSDAISYNVKNVNDCGTYICVVEVVAKEQEGGSTTKAGGYGEIEITMNKAVYNGLSLAKKKVTYNSTPRGDEITVTGLPVTVENGLRTVTLPDGSKVNVNYSYFALAEDGVTRTEIYDVNEIKNVGKYVVVASFSFAVGGDKGNYEPLEELEAELTISADTLSLLEFGFMHGGDKNTQIFSGAYDGTPYWVEVA
ncbi:MAG: hypothetical protein K2K04_03295, partial [Clostridia bacterium]|nr:hypothetical protein [Clostridia bacterium]